MSEPAVLAQRRIAEIATAPDALAVSDRRAGAVTVTIHRGLDSVEAEWRRFEESGDCTPFQCFDWLAAWCRHVGAIARTQPIIVVGRQQDGATLFILPLAMTPGAVRRLTWLGSDLCDYNGPLLAQGASATLSPERFRELWSDIFRRLQADPGTRCDLVELTKMPERVGSQPNPFLALAVGLNPSNAYLSHLSGTWTEFYEAKRSSATRRRDRTKLKRLAEFGEVRFVTPQERGDIERSVAMLMQQKSRSFARMGVDDMFARPGWSEFFAAVAVQDSLRNRIHVSRLDAGSSWTAINLGLVFRDTYYHVLASHDDGEAARFGPGVAHLRELLRFAIERGLKHFDFTIGDERYKREWSNRTLLLYDHVAAASVRGWAAAAAVRANRRLKRLIKQNETLWSLFSRARSAIRLKPAPAADAAAKARPSPPTAPK